ncbi:MAG: hypothetical protein WC125_10115 [Bacteroidales bacterium]
MSDARAVMEKTEYPAVRKFMQKVIEKIKARDDTTIIELDGHLYRDQCSFCRQPLGNMASINEAFPGEIFCSDRCEAEYIVALSKIIIIEGIKGMKTNVH